MNKEDIKSIKNFVEPEDAQAIIDFMEDLKFKKKLNNERGDGTYRIYSSSNPVITSFVKKYSDKFIGDQENLYLRDNLVALYQEGAFMRRHVDVDDGTEIISAVIYLNDDYTGGELLFPEIEGGYSYVPEKYEIVHFPTKFLHEVDVVRSGKRYIVTISFTDKLKYKNPNKVYNT
jgi:predicted 2-oxoglutarate/Fe(II)-dependent dioxygenase YbiX